jgi:hypothetical protein
VRVAAAGALSVLVEVVAVHASITANILWPPSTPMRTAALGALVACSVPVLRRVGQSGR